MYYVDTYDDIYDGVYGVEFNEDESIGLAIPANLLILGDSNFEVSGFTWSAETSADAPVPSNTEAFTGSWSLSWVSTATAGSPTQIHTGLYPCVADKPYIASLWLMPAGNADCYIGLEWCNGSGGVISTQTSTDLVLAGGAWQPLTIAGGAPLGATQVRVFVEVAESNPGDIEYIDLAYLGQCKIQVLADWFNSPYANGSTAGAAFMDITPWVRYDIGINIQSGRQDAISEIQPGACTFTLQNDTGLFTQFNAGSPILANGGDITLGCRYQVNRADENANWWTRADGPLSQISYQGDNTGNANQASITGTDVLSSLSRQDVMTCWTREQVLADGPTYHWSLNDEGNNLGSGVAAETSGNNGPPLRICASGNKANASFTWQDSSAGVETLADAVNAAQPDGSEYWLPGQVQPTSQIRGLDAGVVGNYSVSLPSFGSLGEYSQPSIPLPSVLVGPVFQNVASTANQYVNNSGYYLQAKLPTPIAPGPTQSSYAVEMWYTQDPAVLTKQNDTYGPYIPISLGSTRTQDCLVVGIFLPTSFGAAYYPNPPSWNGANFSGGTVPTPTWESTSAIALDTVKRPHHVVINFIWTAAAGTTVTVWLDGNEIVSTPQPIASDEVFDIITVGAAYGGYGAWYGNLSLVSVYPYALPVSTNILHCQLGQYGMWECTTDDCIAEIAALANVPSFWNDVTAQHAGLSMTDYQDITGYNPLSNMQTYYEDAEQGLLYVSRGGQLTYHTRDWRMGYGAPDLLLTPGSFDADMGFQMVDQFMVNEQAANTNSFSAGVVYVNQDSRQQYGTYAVNGYDEPVTYPLITWNRAYAGLGVDGFGLWGDPALIDNCSWQANTRSVPWLFPGTLKIDLLTIEEDPGINLFRSDFFALDIDNMVAPTGTMPESFPTDQPAVEWFIEGVNETININEDSLGLYCSPAMYQRAWRPSDATYGVLGSTTRIGMSAPDLSTPQADGKDVSHDAGGPYWVPTFGTGMNNPSGNGHDFVGSSDLRGLVSNLQNALTPPIAAVGAYTAQQSFPSGATTTPELFWDTLYTDTASGMAAIPGWPNWYCVTVPGWYEIDAQLVWAHGTAYGGSTQQGWIVVAQAAAQAVAAGTGSPLSVAQYVCPIGEGQRVNDQMINTICCPSTRLYLGLGDMVTIAGEQDSGVSWNTGNDFGASAMSIRFVGLGTQDDRVQINSALSNGGTVTTPPVVSKHSTSFQNTETYSYYGSGAPSSIRNTLRNTNGNVLQGCSKNSYSTTGSQYGQVVFDVTTIRSDLAGTTLTGCTLKCENAEVYPGSNAVLMIGYFVDSPGAGTWKPSSNAANIANWWTESFSKGQTKTFVIPLKIAEALLVNANGLFIGNDSTKQDNYDNQWVGGTGTWTLKFSYTG